MIAGIAVGWRDEVPDGMWLAYGRAPEPRLGAAGASLNLIVVGVGDVEAFELPPGAVKIDLSKADYEALRDRLLREVE